MQHVKNTTLGHVNWDVVCELIDLPSVSVFGRAGVAGVLPEDDVVSQCLGQRRKVFTARKINSPSIAISDASFM